MILKDYQAQAIKNLEEFLRLLEENKPISEAFKNKPNRRAEVTASLLTESKQISSKTITFLPNKSPLKLLTSTT